MRRLAGKVCVVTGAGSGIGAATASMMAAEGASVVVSDVVEARAAAIAAAITQGGGSATATGADVAEEEDVRALMELAVTTFGGLDALHNNAALITPEYFSGDRAITDIDVEVWDSAFRVNLRGAMLGCKHAIPHMLARGGGSIINTGSIDGFRGRTARTAYGASKAGVVSLARSVAVQYGKRGIRCNVVVPGLIQTPAVEANVSARQLEAIERNYLTPRLGLPEDVAAAVVFLASDESKFITASAIMVDGGASAHIPG